VPRRLLDLSVRHVTIHGHRRAFIDVGSGPALLLLHGIGDALQTWDKVIEALAEKHRVIAPDFLGHGQSDKPRADYTIGGFANGMRDLLSHLGIEHVTVVGHSLGGGVAMQFAYQYPERTDRVVLVATGGLGREVSPLLRAISLPGSRPVLWAIEQLPARTAVRTIGTLLSRLPGRPFADVEEALQIYDHLRRADSRRAFLHVLRNAIDGKGQVITMLDRLYLAEALPLLVLWGERDPIIPVKHTRNALAACPSIDVQLLPGGGHFPHRDDPAWFVDRVEEFIAQTQPARHERIQWRRLIRSGAQP
jgi:pimeloyl-ACP methyl ester carboxylesterase